MRITATLIVTASLMSACATENEPLNHRTRPPTNIGVPQSFKYATDDSSTRPYFLTAYEEAGLRKVEVRNRILIELMGLIDNNYGQFERELSATSRGKNFGVSSTSLVLTGIASFASGGAANVLAAVDTALKGISTAVDKDLLAGKATEALVYQMQANRSKRQELIFRSMKSDEVEYPLEFGLRDLINYFNEGSVTFALVSMTQTVAAAAASAASSARDARIRVDK